MGRRLLAGWRTYWFRPASLADLAIARILVVGILAYLDGTTRFLRVGGVSPQFWKPIEIVHGLGIGQPSVETMARMAEATVVLLVAVGLGVFTRVALALLLVLQLLQEALLNSLGKVSHGTLPLMYALLFLVLSPCDRAFSLGAVWRRARAAGRGALEPPVRRSRFARWPRDLLFIEIAAYYYLAGLSKLRYAGVRWIDGSSLQYYLLQKATGPGLWLAAHPTACAVLSAMVLTFELTAMFGVVRVLRPVVLAGGALFHLGTWVFMDITFWPVVALYTVYVPWRRLATWVARWTGFATRPLDLLYDGGSAGSRRLVSVVRDLDLARRVHLVDVAPHGDPQPAALLVRGPDGRTLAGYDAFRRLAWALPAAWILVPLLYAPGVPSLGRRLHAGAARRRAAAAGLDRGA